MVNNIIRHNLKDNFCFACGTKAMITVHHIRDFHNKLPKKRKADLKGKIPLCRDCHELIEDIVTIGKLKKQSFARGYQKGLDDASRGQHE